MEQTEYQEGQEGIPPHRDTSADTALHTRTGFFSRYFIIVTVCVAY